MEDKNQKTNDENSKPKTNYLIDIDAGTDERWKNIPLNDTRVDQTTYRIKKEGGINNKMDYLVEKYIARISKVGHDRYFTKDEGYKFDFVNNFQNNFDIQAEDFHAMMSKALPNNNLTSGNYFFPLSMLLRFIGKDTERVRDAFTRLYNEEDIVKYRIDDFQAVFDNMMEEENMANGKNDHTFIDLRFISLLLAIMYPDKYYYMKLAEYKKVAKYFDDNFVIPQGASVGEKYEILSLVADEVRDEIKKYSEINSVHNNFISDKYRVKHEKMFKDENYCWVTQDFIFISGHLLINNDKNDTRKIISGDVGGVTISYKS